MFQGYDVHVPTKSTTTSCKSRLLKCQCRWKCICGQASAFESTSVPVRPFIALRCLRQCAILSAQAHMTLSKVQVAGRAAQVHEGCMMVYARCIPAWRLVLGPAKTGADACPRSHDFGFWRTRTRQQQKAATWHLDRVRAALHRASQPAAGLDMSEMHPKCVRFFFVLART